MINCNSDRKNYYFTWGTLKYGFPNHDKYKDILGERFGKFSTVSALSLIVPTDRFCPNPGCSLVHRIGALSNEIQGRSDHIDGEVYLVSDKGLTELDKLEHYDPEDKSSSAYIRRMIKVCDTNSENNITAFTYFIADDTKYVELLNAEMAETVSNYTLEMASGTPKSCCVANPSHSGDHCILPFPIVEKAEKVN